MERIIKNNFQIQSKDGRITGIYLSDGKVRINKGSFFRNNEVNSLRQNIKNLRMYLTYNDYVKDHQLVKDYVFESPSEAISSLMGHMENGNKGFITLDNIELGDFLEIFEDTKQNKVLSTSEENTQTESMEQKIQYDRNLFFEDDNFVIVTSIIEVDNESTHSPIYPSQKQISEISKFKRNIKIAREAITVAKYQCEINKDHETFLTRNSHPYMEAHHLIPLSMQDKFDYSLDVAANIICLCPTCHRMIHYSSNSKILIKKLYEDRKENLKLSGIEISLNDLMNIYK